MTPSKLEFYVGQRFCHVWGDAFEVIQAEPNSVVLAPENKTQHSLHYTPQVFNGYISRGVFEEIDDPL